MIDELQVDGDHRVGVGGVDLPGEALGDVEPRLPPHDVKVRTEFHGVFLKIDIWSVK